MKRSKYTFYTIETKEGIDLFTDFDEAVEFLQEITTTICKVEIGKTLKKDSVVTGFGWKLQSSILVGFNQENWYVENS